MQNINLDVTPSGIPQVAHVSQFDYKRPIRLNLHDGDEEYMIPTGAVVTIRGTKSDGHPFSYTSTDEPEIVTFSGVTVIVYTSVQMTAAAGLATCEIGVSDGTSILYSANWTMDVEAMALPQDADLSEIDIPIIIKAIEAGQTVSDIKDQIAKAQEILDDMDADVKAASASQTAAATSEKNAKTSETNAAASATTATDKATAAASSATKAANQAKLSESWAVGGTGARNGEDTNNSKYYAEQSSLSATAAATSEKNTKTSETNAATSAAAAQRAADAAEHTDVGSLAKLVDAVEKAEATVEKNLTAVNHDVATYPAFVVDRLADVTDLNDCTTNGIYQFTAAASNNPVSAIGMVLVLNSTGSGETGYIAQYAWAASDAHTVYARDDHGGTWGAWKKVAADIDGVLSATSTNPVANKAIVEGASTIINNLPSESSAPSDGTEIVFNYASSATAVRKPVSALWSYTQGKISSVLGITAEIVTALQKAVEGKADKATTLAGYGITDGYTAAEGTGLDARLTSAENSISKLTNGKLSITNIGSNAKTTDYNDAGIYYGSFDDCPGDSTKTWGAMIVLFLPSPYIVKVYIKQIWNGKIQIFYNNANSGWIQLH